MENSKSREYLQYKRLEHWQPAKAVITAPVLAEKADPLYPLFSYLYEKTKRLYARMDARKNGEEAFVHPVNVVWDLRKAGISTLITLCVGLIHDVVEEEVDIYKKKMNMGEISKVNLLHLTLYEKKLFEELEKELTMFCKEHQFKKMVAQRIVQTTKLLTKHKRDFYYRYITGIFEEDNDELQEMAIQVKLADRTHNILSIECFVEQERINQCFKNFFLLNNTKQYLLEKYGPEIFTTSGKFSPTERLFNKCAKATYDAYLTILHLCHEKGIGKVKSMIQLAFKKFAFEKRGLSLVTEVDPHELHPLRLFQGVVRKYDARLHHEWKEFERIKKEEQIYLSRFFSDFHLTADQLQAVSDYKDAYAMKESLSRILYQPDYVVGRFLCGELTKEGRINQRKKKNYASKSAL